MGVHAAFLLLQVSGGHVVSLCLCVSFSLHMHTRYNKYTQAWSAFSELITTSDDYVNIVRQYQFTV